MAPLLWVVTLVLILVLLYTTLNRRIVYVIVSRWLRFHSELMDRTIGLRLEKKLAEYAGHAKVMLGSSTIAYMSVLDDDYINLGVPSLCTHHLMRYLDVLHDMQVEQLVFYAGINDTIINTPPITVAHNTRDVIRAIDAVDVLYIPLIESPYQRSVGKDRLEYIRAINRAVKEALADFHNVVLLRPKFGDEMFRFDRLHLNKQGNAHMRQSILAHVTTSAYADRT